MTQPADSDQATPGVPRPPAEGRRSWTAFHTIGLLALLGGLVAVGLLVTAPLWAWLVIMLLLALSMAIAGKGVVGLWRGVLVDERQQLSLSRLQLVLWTILILGGYLTAALANLQNAVDDPLAVAVPPELWAVLGISVTSLVGAPLIRKPKKDRTESRKEFRRTRELAKAQGVPGAETAIADGQIVEKLHPRDASLGDIFRGEEVGNWASLDLSKLQMLYFTVILVLAYGFALGALLADAAEQPITEFPALGQGFVALLGISHAGYLSFKAVPHSGTGDDTNGQ